MRLPDGFKTAPSQAVRSRLKLCDCMSKIMTKYGFRPTVVSSLYPMGDNVSGADDRFKTVDNTGEVLCVLDDAVLGLRNAVETDMERLSTFCEVYKFHGEERNRAQFAALLAGYAGFEAESEMISCAVSLMRDLGVEYSKILLSDTHILQGIAELIAPSAPYGLIKAVLNGTFTPKTDTDYALVRILSATASIKGGEDALRELAATVTNKTSQAGLGSLIDLKNLLADLGYGAVEFDLSLMGQPYEDGVIFRVLDANGNVFVEGGRHNFPRDGKTVPAVHIRIYPDDILATHPLTSPAMPIDVVIGMSDGITALKSAYKLKHGFNEGNLAVALLYRTDKAATVNYAKAFDIENVVYVNDDGSVSDLSEPKPVPAQKVEDKVEEPTTEPVEEPVPPEPAAEEQPEENGEGSAE